MVSRTRWAAPLLLLAALGCSREDEIRAAAAKREALLAATVPKAEFWVEVERKGEAVKATKPIESELAALAAQGSASGAARAAAEQRLGEMRRVREEAETALAVARRELERAKEEDARRAKTLQAFSTAQRANGAP